MTLQEILIASADLSEYDVVYAEKPWTLSSSARVVRYQPDDSVVRRLEGTALDYFLEAPLIQDIRQQLEDGGAAMSDMLRILIYYAEYDAFPE